jgi:hypothetical protein
MRYGGGGWQVFAGSVGSVTVEERSDVSEPLWRSMLETCTCRWYSALRITWYSQRIHLTALRRSVKKNRVLLFGSWEDLSEALVCILFLDLAALRKEKRNKNNCLCHHGNILHQGKWISRSLWENYVGHNELVVLQLTGLSGPGHSTLLRVATKGVWFVLVRWLWRDS